MARIKVQRSGKRFSYVLEIPGDAPFVSAYRYGSEESARKAAEADLAASLVWEKQQRKEI